MENIIAQRFEEHLELVAAVQKDQALLAKLAAAAELIRTALATGHKLLFCGNGGSAADAQHWAAEFVGRFQKERRGLPAIALTVDTSILTAVANDYGYERVFSRQVEALGQPGDVLIGVSTSGNSGNVVAAVELAKTRGLKTVSLTGCGGGKLAQLTDVCLAIPCKVTARVQEVHSLMGHILCELADEDFKQA
jgi:D-sedoheptulose 7-phosphate isomerase